MPNGLVCIILFFSLSTLATADEPAEHLFTISRSTNANIVCYDAHLTAKHEFLASDPIDAYWLMRAEQGQREDLTWFENTHAYGFSLEGPVSPTSLHLTTRAFEQRPIHVVIAGGVAHAEMEVGGKVAILHDVFVKASGGLIPGVDSIDLHGTDHETGEALSETIHP